ncbi:hypothetical protein [Hymenobacter sp.]|jgi:hypothetical protein|uniref:hypothetical protein n=1 Tax=Hymenobacter sp. TaxID=1898978 RepID=UPI002ED843A6
MKKTFTPWLFASLFSVAVQAQTATPIPPKPSRTASALNDQTLVIDASGSTIPAVIWRGMLSSGEYKLMSAPEYSEANPSYRLVALTAVEREKALARVPPPKESPFFTTGQVLAPFKLRDLNGRKFNSQELAGKIVGLNF